MCTPSAPPPPDPNVVSQAQTQSNVDTARTNATLNRVNQFTPYGNLVYSQTTAPSFDQAGYDKAMAAYNTGLAASQATQPGTAQVTPGGSSNFDYGGATAPAVNPIAAPTMPNRDSFNTPGSDQWNATITLDPAQQKLLDANNNIKSILSGAATTSATNAAASLAQPFDTSSFTKYGALPQGGGAQSFVAPDLHYKTDINGKPIQTSLPNSDYAAQRSSVEDAIYSRLNPQLQRDRNQLDQRLANQGIMPGSEAYNNAIDESDRQANDARMQAVLAGGQEQSRLAGLDLQAGQFANSAQGQDFSQQGFNAGLNNTVQDATFTHALQGQSFDNAAQQQNFTQKMEASQAADQQRQQQMQEGVYTRELPLNEMNALQGGAQVANPQFSPQPQTNVAGTNTAGNAFNSFTGQQQNYSNQTAANNSMMQGLFGLGSAYLGSGALGAGAGAAVGGLGASDLATLALLA